MKVISINTFVYESCLIEKKYDKALNNHSKIYKSIKREDNEIDMGISDFSSYYFKLKTAEFNAWKNLLKIELIYKKLKEKLLIMLLNNSLNYDALNYIKLFL